MNERAGSQGPALFVRKDDLLPEKIPAGNAFSAAMESAFGESRA